MKIRSRIPLIAAIASALVPLTPSVEPERNYVPPPRRTYWPWPSNKTEYKRPIDDQATFDAAQAKRERKAAKRQAILRNNRCVHCGKLFLIGEVRRCKWRYEGIQNPDGTFDFSCQRGMKAP